MRAAILAAALAVCALAAGCGEKKERITPGEPQKLQLMLDFFPNADHAGIYAAEAGGHFRDLGLEVEIRRPPDPSAPLKQVAAGRVDLAISYEPELLRARDRGEPVLSVAALVQRPLTSIVSLPAAGIRTPADLRGKRVGTAGIDYQSAYLATILDDAGVDSTEVQERNVGFDLTPALLTGRVDATLGSFWNYEGVDLRLRGRDPRIIRVDEAGVPTYDELIVVANEESLEADESKVRRFIRALARGTADLERDPAAAIRGLLKANPDLDPKLQRAALDVTLPLFRAPRGRPYGYHDREEWDAFVRWLRENDLVRKQGDAVGAFTNELLPGRGL